MDTNTLTQDERDLFLLMQGYAMGAAMANGNKELALIFLGLSNKLNADNPNFRPYNIEELKAIWELRGGPFSSPPQGRPQ